MPILPTFPLSREFINGSDAFCSSMANGMLSAMLEKLRSAANSDGQQCQILQQVNSIEVCRDPGSGSCWDCNQLSGKLDYFMLDGLNALGWALCDPFSRLMSNEQTQQLRFWGVPEDRGVFLHPRADLGSAAHRELSHLP